MAASRIGTNVMLASLLIGLIPIIIMGAISISTVRGSLNSQITKTVLMTLESKDESLFTYYNSVEERTSDIATDADIADRLLQLETEKGDASATNQTLKELDDLLGLDKRSMDQDLAGIFIADTDGTVIASTDPAELGKDEKDDDYFQFGLSQIYLSAHRETDLHFGLTDRFTVAAPVKDPVSGRTLGVLVNVFNRDGIEQILAGGNPNPSFENTETTGNQSEANGFQTLQVYLVDTSKIMFLQPKGTNLSALKGMTIDTPPVNSCFANQTGFVGTYTNYANDEVLGASRCLKNPRMVLIVEVSTSEAFGPVDKANLIIGVVILFFAALVILSGLVVSNALTRPITDLTEVIEKISTGNLDVQIDPKLKESDDEIGELGRAFDRTIVSLKMAMRETAPELKRESQELRKLVGEKEKAEARYRALIQTSPDAITASDLEGRITEVSDQTLKIHGYTNASELIGKNAFELIAPEDRERAMNNLKATAEKGSTRHMQYHLLRKDGSRFIGELNATVLKDPEGRITGFVATSRDITESLKAQEAVRESEEKLSLIFQNVDDAIVFLDKNGRIVTANNTLISMSGYNKEDLLGKLIIELRMFPPASIKKMLEEFAKSIRKQKTGPFEVDAFMKGGGPPMRLEIRCSPMEKDGEFAGIAAIVRDITERKRADEALRDSEERNRTLIDLSPDGIVVHDGETIHFSNPAAAKLLGAASPGELVGKRVFDIVHPDYRKVVQKRVEKQRRGEAVPHIMEKFIRLDGKTIDVDVAAAPVTYEGKTAMQVVFRNITESLKAQEAVQESEEKLSLIFQNVEDGIIFLDKDGKILTANETLTKLSGYKLSEVAGKRLDELTMFTPESLEKILNAFSQRMDGKSIEPYEAQASRKGGGPLRTVEIRGKAILKDGKPIGAIAILRDITERKIIEDTLKDSEEKLSLIFNNVEDCVVVLDINGVIIASNDTLSRLIGYGKDEVVGKQITELEMFPQESRKKILDSFLKRIKGKKLEPYDVVAFKKGSRVPLTFEIRAWPVIKEGKATGTVAIVRDVTAHKQSEDAIKASEERYRLLTELTSEAIIIHDNGKLLDANQAAERLFGYSLKEIKGTNIFDLIAPEYRDVAVKSVQAGYEGKNRLRVVKKDGSLAWIESWGKPIEFGGRKVRMVALREIPEQEAAQRSKNEGANKTKRK